MFFGISVRSVVSAVIDSYVFIESNAGSVESGKIVEILTILPVNIFVHCI